MRNLGKENTEEVLQYSDRARWDKAMFVDIPQSAWRQFRHKAFQQKYSRKTEEVRGRVKLPEGGHKYPRWWSNRSAKPIL